MGKQKKVPKKTWANPTGETGEACKKRETGNFKTGQAVISTKEPTEKPLRTQYYLEKSGPALSRIRKTYVSDVS